MGRRRNGSDDETIYQVYVSDVAKTANTVLVGVSLSISEYHDMRRLSHARNLISDIDFIAPYDPEIMGKFQNMKIINIVTKSAEMFRYKTLDMLIKYVSQGGKRLTKVIFIEGDYYADQNK